MWNRTHWKRDSSYSGPVLPNPSSGIFLYLARCPRHMFLKVGIGGYSRMHEWETRRWQIRQYHHFGEDARGARSTEKLIKERICCLRTEDWPYSTLPSGKTESWPLNWGEIDLGLVVAGHLEEAFPPALLTRVADYRTGST